MRRQTPHDRIELGKKLYMAVEPHLHDESHEWRELEPNLDAWHAFIDAHHFPAWIQRLDRRIDPSHTEFSEVFVRDQCPADWFTFMVVRCTFNLRFGSGVPGADLLIYGYTRSQLYRSDPAARVLGLLEPNSHSPSVRAGLYEIPRELYL